MTDKLNVVFSGDFLRGHTEEALMELGFGGLRSHEERIRWAWLPEAPMDADIRAGDLTGSDALVLRAQHLRRDALTEAVAETLTAVVRWGSGYDKVDVEACTEAGVLVCNAPGGVTHGTAFGAFVLLGAVSRHLVALDKTIRSGRWYDRNEHVGTDLQRKTLGIIGPGRIGREVIRLVAPLEMRVLAWSPRLTPERAGAMGAESVTLERLLGESDFVCVTCQLCRETVGLIGERELGLMKPSAYLVNVSRGEVIDEPALVKALAEHRIAGAGLDVFAEEPIGPDNPLLRLENVVLTPHFIGYSYDVIRNTSQETIGNLVRLAEGQLPATVINPSVVDRPGFRSKLERFAGHGIAEFPGVTAQR